MIDHDGLGDSGSDSEIVAGGKPALKRKQSRKGCDFFGAEKASTLADVFLVGLGTCLTIVDHGGRLAVEPE